MYTPSLHRIYPTVAFLPEKPARLKSKETITPPLHETPVHLGLLHGLVIVYPLSSHCHSLYCTIEFILVDATNPQHAVSCAGAEVVGIFQQMNNTTDIKRGKQEYIAAISNHFWQDAHNYRECDIRKT